MKKEKEEKIEKSDQKKGRQKKVKWVMTDRGLLMAGSDS